MNDEKQAYLRNWLTKADHDLTNAKTILSALPDDESTPYDTVCFHCQQAVEKLLKAFLINHGRMFPRSHNLADLVRLCSEIDPGLMMHMETAEQLTPYAVEIRYPDDFYMPSLKEAEEALQIAFAIRSHIHGALNISSENGQ